MFSRLMGLGYLVMVTLASVIPAAASQSTWVDASEFGSLSAAINAVGTREKAVLISDCRKVTADMMVPSKVTLWFVPGGYLDISPKVTVTILGPINAGLNRIFAGDGVVKFNSDFYGCGNIGEVYSEWWGAKADDHTDCTLALQRAVDVCGQSRVLKLIDGVYRITSVVKARCSIQGTSPYNCAIHNTGTGDALYIYAPYMQLWKNFAVRGNPNSRDGITLYGDDLKGSVCYSSFENVYSSGNGRHGLYHRTAWGTKYINCKFEGNGGLGIFLDTREGDPGTHNGVSFINCESRGNGGNDPTTTQDDDKGGVKVVGAAMVAFIGGVYESNNAWGFIISNQHRWATRNVHIKNIYMEDCPHAAKVGGLFYVGGSWEYVTVEQSWLGYGTGPGRTGYCFYIGDDRSTDAAVFNERDNFTVAGGPPSNSIRSHGTTHDKSQTLISNMFGDIGSEAKETTTTILKVSDDGAWIVNGSIVVSENGNSPGGSFPFVVSRSKSSRRTVTVGSPTVGSAGTAPVVAFKGDELQVTLPKNRYAFAKVEEQIARGHEPTVFEWSADLFGTMMRRR